MSQALAEPPAAVAAAAPALLIEDVVKRFGAFVALDGVSLSVRPGEFVSFVGPSGCGKTTLLRAIAGLDPPSSGRIVQAGRDVTALPPSARDFGIVFQSYALFPNLTVLANIGYGLRGRAWPRARARARVEELLALTGLAEQARKYPAQISGGQQQRVALARALASGPGLLLLDEPLSALDAVVRLHLRSEIRALQRRLGITTIMVTHDQEEAMSVSDRLVVMDHGRIEQTGTPRDVYRNPASAFVAGFIGRGTAVDGVVEPGGIVRTCGVALRADAARRFPPGAAVRAFIRPEDVRLGEGADATACVITGIEYLGPVCRVCVQAGALLVEADIRADELGPGAAGTVCMTIPAARVLVFAAGG